MVSDQDIAKEVESLIRNSDPNSFTTLNGVVQQLEARLGLDLSHKAGFIRDQIDLLLRSSNPQPQAFPSPPASSQPKDTFTLSHQPQFPPNHPHHFTSHFTLHPHHPSNEISFRQPQQPPASARPPQMRSMPPQAQVVKHETYVQNAATAARESAPTGGKKRGGAGGLNKVCGVSPELQAIVGEPALPRTEIVKQLWAYIRKNNLQDPSNKRKIICDDALRVVFETDCTDMFKMNKLLAKHIIPLAPTKESSQAKRLKVDVESTPESADPGSTTVIISEALANFLGTGEKEMKQSEPIRLVWEYIKVNHLEDPLNSMVILCDAKLQELLGCESISALGMQEMLARNHFFKRS